VSLDDVQIAEALRCADEIEHWISATRTEGLKRALSGRTLPNWKLVEGRRGNRAMDETLSVTLPKDGLLEIGVDAEEAGAIVIEDAIHFAAGNEAYKKRELKSVAQLQKLLEKKTPSLWAQLQEYITQAPGKPALERMEDPRPPMPVVSAEFPV